MVVSLCWYGGWCAEEERKSPAEVALGSACLCVLLQVSQPPTDLSCCVWVTLFGDKRRDEEKCMVLRAAGSEFVATANNFCSLGCPGGHQVDHGLTTCPCCKGGEWCPGLHYEGYCQQVKACDLSPLPGVL